METDSEIYGSRKANLTKLTESTYLDLVILLSIICTYGNSFSYLWTNRLLRVPKPRISSMVSAMCLLFGTISYLHVHRMSSLTQLPQRLSTRFPSWLYALFVSLTVSLVFLEISSKGQLTTHPIEILMTEASANYGNWFREAGKSKTLGQTVEEYRRRYNRHPPPGFDKWYDYATARSSLIIDDYDGIFNDLLPFWALDPQSLRSRTREILSDPWNEVAEVSIRSGKAEIGANVLPTHKWMLDGVLDMMKDFVQWLPDMDLAFNINDESRVAIPYDDLERYLNVGRNTGKLEVGKETRWSNNRAQSWPSNNETAPPKSRFEDHSFTKTFYDYGSISCAPNSPARRSYIWDPHILCTSCTAPHSFGPFIRNWTLAASPCHQPDMANLHGFYLSPAAFKTSHDLLPVFSQSKVHGYSDILYPSPWNYMDKVKYDPSPQSDTQTSEDVDPPFAKKQKTLFWRGATSEGLSNYGTWKGMTRQRLVHYANNNTRAVPILLPSSRTTSERYKYYSLAPSQISQHPHLQNLTLDLAIVDGVVRCAGPDCPVQESEFAFVQPIPFQSHWQYKFLMDVDGAGFSGRFLPFLQSRSLPFKAALFREWHDGRIWAWRHFVPVDLRLQGLWSTVAYFGGFDGGVGDGGGSASASKSGTWTRKGPAKAEMIAEAGRDWAGKVLRKEDMEIYFFRVLLEWGRLTDDGRDEIGFGFGV